MDDTTDDSEKYLLWALKDELGCEDNPWPFKEPHPIYGTNTNPFIPTISCPLPPLHSQPSQALPAPHSLRVAPVIPLSPSPQPSQVQSAQHSSLGAPNIPLSPSLQPSQAQPMVQARIAGHHGGNAIISLPCPALSAKRKRSPSSVITETPTKSARTTQLDPSNVPSVATQLQSKFARETTQPWQAPPMTQARIAGRDGASATISLPGPGISAKSRCCRSPVNPEPQPKLARTTQPETNNAPPAASEPLAKLARRTMPLETHNFAHAILEPPVKVAGQTTQPGTNKVPPANSLNPGQRISIILGWLRANISPAAARAVEIGISRGVSLHDAMVMVGASSQAIDSLVSFFRSPQTLNTSTSQQRVTPLPRQQHRKGCVAPPQRDIRTTDSTPRSYSGMSTTPSTMQNGIMTPMPPRPQPYTPSPHNAKAAALQHVRMQQAQASTNTNGSLPQVYTPGTPQMEQGAARSSTPMMRRTCGNYPTPPNSREAAPQQALLEHVQSTSKGQSSASQGNREQMAPQMQQAAASRIAAQGASQASHAGMRAPPPSEKGRFAGQPLPARHRSLVSAIRSLEKDSNGLPSRTGLKILGRDACTGDKLITRGGFLYSNSVLRGWMGDENVFTLREWAYLTKYGAKELCRYDWSLATTTEYWKAQS